MKRLILWCVIAFTSMAAIGQPHLQPKNYEEFAKLLSVQDSQKSLSSRTLSILSGRIPETTLERYINWHNIAMETTALDHTPVEAGSGDDPRRFAQQLGPHRASYAMAIVHVAMFEAVNAIHQTHQSYVGLPPVNGLNNSVVATDRAIAQATRDTLISLYRYQEPRINALFTQDVARMPKPPAVPQAELDAGAKVGSDAAKAILVKRAGDGADHMEPIYGVDYTPKPCGGAPCPEAWSPDPISNLTVALGAKWATVRPFVMTSAEQFRPAQYPKLDSPHYLAAFNEVKQYGADGTTSATDRRDFQTFEGLFWAYDGTPALCAPPRLYNKMALDFALSRKSFMTISDYAAYMARINVAMADAGISAWEAKYFYQLWRPVTGIRNAQGGTTADPSWTPLGAPATNGRGPNFTPPFPSYPSGHAVFGGAVLQVMREEFKGDFPFTLISDEYNGQNYGVGDAQPRPSLPQSFVSFSHAEYANGRSRIWLGIHWQFDADAGIAQGNRVGSFVVANSFKKLP
ncbi:vanadium-dependent haloperoxidase [Piscinibacter koreensis]|uniref:Vanadium-dependent haloperoxidase n=1 Tax=Piscinibacter koreensis TaxID=2742824 RepID=A0A7Y6NNY4_9BURK|nr:vanadium-dependent haloperoxidase [Schlegelella koreensis]NUZ06562.1 vanadium-dependent haloperoxidase [Schlegelella koreensis]